VEKGQSGLVTPHFVVPPTLACGYAWTELDNMHNHVPFSAAGNGLPGFGLLGNGGSDGCGDFV